MRRWASIGAAVVAVVYLLSGVFIVDTGDVAVVFRLGAVHRTAGAGPGVRLPWPLERHTIVSVSEVQRAEPGRTRMLTGDTNLIDLDLVVQLTVADPTLWLTGARDPKGDAAAVVTATATDVVASMDVDTLLTTGRAELQQRVRADAQAVLDAARSGARIDAVDIRELTPPPAVVDAFNDVSSARGDKETLALGAEAYASKRLPEARGRGAALRSEAQARAFSRVSEAQSDIARFEALRSSPDLRAERARRRAATLSQIHQRATVLAVPAGTPVVLPAATKPPSR